MTAAREPDKKLGHGSQTKRFATAEKVTAVLRLLKGESAAILCRELDVSVQRLERWQGDFIAGGTAALSNRKSSATGGWLSKHAAAIFQWIAFLIVLAIAIAILQWSLQRGSD